MPQPNTQSEQSDQPAAKQRALALPQRPPAAAQATQQPPAATSSDRATNPVGPSTELSLNAAAAPPYLPTQSLAGPPSSSQARTFAAGNRRRAADPDSHTPATPAALKTGRGGETPARHKRKCHIQHCGQSILNPPGYIKTIWGFALPLVMCMFGPTVMAYTSFAALSNSDLLSKSKTLLNFNDADIARVFSGTKDSLFTTLQSFLGLYDPVRSFLAPTITAALFCIGANVLHIIREIKEYRKERDKPVNASVQHPRARLALSIVLALIGTAAPLAFFAAWRYSGKIYYDAISSGDFATQALNTPLAHGNQTLSCQTESFNFFPPQNTETIAAACARNLLSIMSMGVNAFSGTSTLAGILASYAVVFLVWGLSRCFFPARPQQDSGTAADTTPLISIR
ncbi:MAG: hypothetical protein COV52_07625 [Gammaproteobacteria bacterium CG11_big_fil_rev_8_21_14_0_20_46_22]|nr:MAG: hypothetical protein COW05_06865 [Gammaproteobacteria bacterium CG12_big_fil_rev_8_21_14_0_65_46_12]PIR10749.1 MAG: hypothetical protein COV52_07625 [Gammaproteobacteria bacterium CG11_big_fil_rev_8_21_14_0_20_46_22]